MGLPRTRLVVMRALPRVGGAGVPLIMQRTGLGKNRLQCALKRAVAIGYVEKTRSKANPRHVLYRLSRDGAYALDAGYAYISFGKQDATP